MSVESVEQTSGPAKSRVSHAVSVVVPCYNEEGAIRETVMQLNATLKAASSRYELIVVDDGSADGSADILEDLVRSVPRLRVLTHERNRGYGAALKTGIVAARHDLIAITDADGTYPNERLPELIAEAADAGMAVGARVEQGVQYSKLRAIPKSFLRRWASWLAGQSIPDINSGLRVFHKQIALRFLPILPDTFSFTTTITLAMLRNYYEVRFVPIGYTARIGKSKIRPFTDTLRFVMLLLRTGIYFAPLRLLSPAIGFLGLASLASLTFDVFILQNLTDKTVVLFLFTLNTGMLALLADMIDKRTGR
ncbi:MAG: glycosyltransferase family 2 protein [Alphaproteobacteria bacterium]